MILNILNVEKVKVGSMPKFMQTLEQPIYNQLERIAKERGIKVQELVRAVIVPEWLKNRE